MHTSYTLTLISKCSPVQVARNGAGGETVQFIFSCWDADSVHRVGWTTPTTCSRFGGEVGLPGVAPILDIHPPPPPPPLCTHMNLALGSSNLCTEVLCCHARRSDLHTLLPA